MKRFNDIVREYKLEGQVQYLSRYLDPFFINKGYLNLADGLRVQQKQSGDYHSWIVHPEDVSILVERFKSLDIRN
jgi:hypothetical protein